MTGCDRTTLEGLNLKINADIKSGYDNDNASKEKSAPENPGEGETETTPRMSEREKEDIPTNLQNKPIVEVNNTKVSDPDAPMAFEDIPQCSKSGITAKTNEIFYANNGQVKSIDSKNEAQVKQWKKIYGEIEKNCNSK